MSTTPDTTGAPTRLTVRNKIGLALAALLGLGDVISMFVIDTSSSEQPGPPPEIMIVGGVLGVITLVAVAVTVRTGSRLGARITCGSRILSMLTALPAFFVPDVPAEFVAMATIGVLLTLLSVWLVLARSARPDR